MEHSSSTARWISKMGIEDDKDSEQIYNQINLFTDSFTDFKLHPSSIHCFDKPSDYRVTNESPWATNITTTASAKIQNRESMTIPKPETVSSKQNSKIIPFGENESDNSLSELHYMHAGDLNNTLKLWEQALCAGSCTDNTSCENIKSALMRNNDLISTGSGNIIGVKRLSTSTITRTRSSFAHDHVVAERQRREQLSQLFIALSALVPCLKKMDKASVLAGAVRYLKELQEKVKVLEKQTANRAVESVVCVKKSRLAYTDETSSSYENSETDQLSSDCPLPEIEARIWNDEVLIKIHCENSPNRGVATCILVEIEKLKLTIMSSHIVAFGNHAIDITVVAKMEASSTPLPADLIESLRQAVAKAKRSTNAA